MLKVSFGQMTAKDASVIEDMMASESSAYMDNFLAFRAKEELVKQITQAKKDVFLSIRSCDQPSLVGFYCLRGLDEGYEKPTFGIYVSSNYSAKGVGEAATKHAISYCTANEIGILMLKVDPQNVYAKKIYERAGFVNVGLCSVTGHDIMEKRCR